MATNKTTKNKNNNTIKNSKNNISETTETSKYTSHGYKNDVKFFDDITVYQIRLSINEAKRNKDSKWLKEHDGETRQGRITQVIEQVKLNPYENTQKKRGRPKKIVETDEERKIREEKEKKKEEYKKKHTARNEGHENSFVNINRRILVCIKDTQTNFDFRININNVVLDELVLNKIVQSFNLSGGWLTKRESVMKATGKKNDYYSKKAREVKEEYIEKYKCIRCIGCDKYGECTLRVFLNEFWPKIKEEYKDDIKLIENELKEQIKIKKQKKKLHNIRSQNGKKGIIYANELRKRQNEEYRQNNEYK